MNRIDNWTEAQDKVLAETILEYVATGKTQLQAFEDVGDKLNRTSQACGFRWNSHLRKEYVMSLEIAKKECKEYLKQQKQIKGKKKSKIVATGELVITSIPDCTPVHTGPGVGRFTAVPTISYNTLLSEAEILALEDLFNWVEVPSVLKSFREEVRRIAQS